MIRLEGVSFFHGDLEVLAGCDLAVGKGERVALLGPSGSGKTTLLRLIAGLEMPDAGRVLLDGKVASDPGGGTAPNERSIGYAFQEPALWPHLTVARHLTFGMTKGQAAGANAWVEQIVGSFGLAGLEERYPGELSGGQARRVELARAFARTPKRLLLDEPLAHLDRSARDELRGAAVGLCDAMGATVVWVTHDEDEARSVAARVVRLEGGRCAG